MTSDMLEFIKDNKDTFNDKQLLKALYLLNSNNIFHNIILRIQIFHQLCHNIQDGKFDFRRGNTLAMFAEAMVQIIEANVSDTRASDEAPFNFLNGQKQ